jgi:hypothetical protein
MIETMAPIEVEITVASDVALAFRTFTEDIGSWWPTRTHSVGEERVTAVILEPRVGGRFYERWDGGTRVRLEHRGWERLGTDGVELRRDYESGWTPVMERFTRRCGEAPEAPGL